VYLTSALYVLQIITKFGVIQHQTQGFYFIFSLHHFRDDYSDELKQRFPKDKKMLNVSA